MDSNPMSIPEKSRPREEILDAMRSFGRADPDYKTGRTWSLVYYLGEEYTQFLKDAHGMFFSANGLNPMAFKSLKRFESEVIRMTSTLLHGDENVCGTMTAGGTESCLLAVKTYRDLVRSKRLSARKPEMILPESAHVAWEKGAKYFGVKAVHAPLDKNFCVDVNSVRKKINRRTIMILSSAPQYPHGMIDPIEDLGRLARKKNIPLHVDACVGGYLLPFVEQLGYEVPLFDFRIPGVTSISADTHKYGYAAKGASTILYRNIDYLKHQIFVYENWPGGVFASPAILGTRPGGSIAAAWAAMQAMGQEGYLENARVIMKTTGKLIDGINGIKGLEVLGDPPMSLFAFHSIDKKVNIYAVGDCMEKKGWHIDRQQRPECLHAMVTPLHSDVASRYLTDLAEAVEYVRNHPELTTQGAAAMYGMIANVPLRGMIRKEILKMMTDMYGPGGKTIDPANTGLSENTENTKRQKSDWATKAALAFVRLKRKFGR